MGLPAEHKYLQEQNVVSVYWERLQLHICGIKFRNMPITHLDKVTIWSQFKKYQIF